jgi:hypothetical protein
MHLQMLIPKNEWVLTKKIILHSHLVLGVLTLGLGTFNINIKVNLV